MSDLAYNLNGEPFEVPGAAVAWRVRRLKAKGAPEVVYGREGIPLVLPIDADMDDLRREARTEGRYRLDPLDENSRPIAGCPAGYVCIHEGEPTVEPPPSVKVAPAMASADQAVVEAMRVNAELARSVIERFPAMLESAAVLLRAADNAGMPQRIPRFIEVAEEPHEADAEDDGKVEETVANPPLSLQGIIDTVVKVAVPAIVNAAVQGKIKIPGGLGALVDCRRAIPTERTSAPPQTNSPDAAPAPGPSNPAPAPSSRKVANDVAGSQAPAEPAGDLPTLDAAALVHFNNIRHALTLREQELAQAMVEELSPAELRAWLTDLKPLSVPDAVARIRSVLGSQRADVADRPIPRSGGASVTEHGGAS